MSGFSRMMSDDDAKTVGVIEDFQRRIKGLVEEFEGRMVDTGA